METAIQQAAAIYARHGMNLAADLEHYLKFGYAFVTPDYLLLGRPVDLEKGVDVWCKPDEGDCWFVRLAVGKGAIPRFFGLMPFPKPFVAWGRDFRDQKRHLHVYETKRLLKFLS